MNEGEKTVIIRRVDIPTWRRFKAWCASEGHTLAQGLRKMVEQNYNRCSCACASRSHGTGRKEERVDG